ncbi:CDP-alcohol phosphatidyltransferase [Balamuthia mandrillaris]
MSHVLVESTKAQAQPEEAEGKKGEARPRKTPQVLLQELKQKPVPEWPLAILLWIESFLFVMVEWYDLYVYSPLQTGITPLVKRVPRSVRLSGREYFVFTANIVTLSRTLLVIPIMGCVKAEAHWAAFLLVLLHDFLDHLDGIVAVAHRDMGYSADPLLGSFLDAFCDKVVNVFAIWGLLMATDYSGMSVVGLVSYLGICGSVIAYEIAIGLVRVEDFYYSRYKGITPRNLRASMEGKLKEKLESMGVAFLCLSMTQPLSCMSGYFGLLCLSLCVRLAHSSLSHKLSAWNQNNKSE